MILDPQSVLPDFLCPISPGKKAVNEVKDEIGGIAMEIESKVVEREISEKDHKDLIDEFIKNVGEAS